tara:strand:- start:218 stop:433 length:216 start_codon:yes stop_codon:yes gene_type:complete
MERRRRKDAYNLTIGGNPAKFETDKQVGTNANTQIPPTALELAYQFLETGSLNDNNYYQTRWRFYENGDVE